MRFENNKQYKVIKKGACLVGLPTQNRNQEQVILNEGDTLVYVGHEYEGVDYDVIQPPYFRYKGKDYVFEPSSFSGLVPDGFLAKIDN